MLVEGRLAIRSYEDKDGNKRKATEVVIDNMQMLDSKGGGGGGGAPRSNGDGGSYDNVRPMTRSNGASTSLDEETLDDEIPF